MSGSNSNLGNSIFDALTNPGLDALLGMTQGFASAAMPTRMPTPWGAVLGMGVGGALPGISAGQQLRHAGIANQQAQMGLDWYKNMMGPQASGNSGMTPTNAAFGAPNATDASGKYLISPGMLASMAQLLIAQGKDPSGVMKLIESYSGGNGYAMGSGGQAFAVPGGAADPRVAGTLAASKATGEAMGKPPIDLDITGPDGTHYKQQVTIPQANQYLSGFPGGGAAAPASGALPASDWASRLNGTENATGNPAAKNPRSSATGNGQFLDSTWIDQTRKAYPAQTANMSDSDLLKLRADPILSHQMTMAYGAENANVLAQNGIQPNATTLAAAHKLGPNDAVKVLSVARTAPQTPLSAVLSPDVIKANPQFQRQTAGNYVFGLSGQFGAAPVDFGRGAVPQVATNAPTQGAVPTGMVAGPGVPQPVAPSVPGAAPNPNVPGVPGMPVLTPQQQSAQEVEVARQKAINEALASRMRLVTTRSGVYDPMTGKEIYRQPEYEKTVDPNTGIEYPSYIYSNTHGGLTVEGGPPGYSEGQVPPTKLGPGQHELMTQLAEQYGKEDKQKYEGATNSLFQLAQQDQNISALNQAGGWSSTGAGADFRLKWAKNINSAFATLGIDPVLNPYKVASWEDATKLQTQLAFAQAKQLGSREAQQVISMSRAATPGAENTPLGYQAISAGYHDMNNREVDLYNYKTAWLQSHGGNLIGAETAFNKAFSPEMYGMRARSSVEPIKINTLDQAKAQEEFQKYLPGTVVQFPNGKKTIVPPRDNAPPVPGYINSLIQSGSR